MDIESQRLQVGASIGIALCCSTDLDPDTLMRQADVAMYAGEGERPQLREGLDDLLLSRRASAPRPSIGLLLARSARQP